MGERRKYLKVMVLRYGTAGESTDVGMQAQRELKA